VAAQTGLEYAPRGLIGALTPQANTTVEPEFNILWPPGYAMINARLTSPHGSIEARLRDYWATTEAALDQFANAPVSAAAFGCTGASYLAGKDDEDALVGRIEAARGYPFITSARAVCDMLRALGAESIGQVSPYPDDLTEASIGYWRSRRFAVAECAGAFNTKSSFHPIYSLAASSARDGLLALRDKPVEAIVMLGTGMPTLAPIAEAAAWDGPPVMSCMLCLAWRTIQAIEGRSPSAESAMSWINGTGWSDRLAATRG
jgi:maleate cis-trans isomerase